jgi:hypothetical protein
MKSIPKALKKITFRAKLERIADDMQYFAFTISLKTSEALGTRGPVHVAVSMHKFPPFLVSVAPIGCGRHWLRVNAKARKAAGIEEGEAVNVEIRVQSGSLEIPADLAKALRADRVTDFFNAMSIGTQNFHIKKIDSAAKQEIRKKRIEETVQAAQAKREKKLDTGKTNK